MIDNTGIPCSNCKINLELDPFDISAGLFDYIARTVCHSGKKLNIFYTCKYISSNQFIVYTLVHICNFTEFLVK